MKNVLVSVGVVLLMIIAYLLLWPVPIEPEKVIPNEMPEMKGDYEPNYILKEIDVLAKGYCLTPEDVAFDSDGRMYSGMTELGVIMRFSLDGTNPEVFAETGGKIAGLNFDIDGNLLIADVEIGLLSISPDGEMSVLVDRYMGEKLYMINDVDVASDGTVYFSQTSTKYIADDMFYDIMEYKPNGRLFAYYPKTHELVLLLEDLYFANGVTMSPDEDYVLVSETSGFRISRYYLDGDMAGERDLFIDNLPGLPDNIDFDDEGICWIAIVDGPEQRRTIDFLLLHPYLRKIIVRVPTWITQPKSAGGYAFIIGLSEYGEIIYNLQDPEGEIYNNITSVTEHNGKLYLGTNNHALDGIGVINKP